MKIEIKIDDTAAETKVIIVTREVTESVQTLVKRLSEEHPKVIAGFSEDTVRLLEQKEILRIYAADGKVFAVTEKGEFTLRLRLYELEERLDKKRFVRISNSEIVNLGKVRGFDLSFSGTIRVSLTNGTSTYVSRRYVSKIKTTLGL
ncbi:MAG: LytTR family transcriptional regulator [Oscillospiraceae bacterium]|nr:LytTR family transcriptional regulator [Oscillospiraceae bacterium]